MTAFIEGILFSGSNLGWSSLVFILKQENYFINGCPTIANSTMADTCAAGNCLDFSFSGSARVSQCQPGSIGVTQAQSGS